jgi:hypothetical protein
MTSYYNIGGGRVLRIVAGIIMLAILLLVGGANAATSSPGTGFSQSCPDSNGDGICDSPYTQYGNNIDYLPLSTNITSDTTPPVITNFRVSPNTSVNKTNPAIATAYVSDADLKEVTFGVVDSNNLVDTNMTVIGFSVNKSGISGRYVSPPWGAFAVSITNGTARDVVTLARIQFISDYYFISGSFKKNSSSSEKEALMWFNKTTNRLFIVIR